MRKRNENVMKENEGTEEITTPPILTCYKDSRPRPAVSQYQFDAPVTKATFASPTTPISMVAYLLCLQQNIINPAQTLAGLYCLVGEY